MKVIALLFSILFVLYSHGQTNPKKGMTYDKENMMYYHISNDDKYLYLNFYKDEYASKVTNLGGIKIFFNMTSKKDTINVPNVVYPVYAYPNKDFEVIVARGFTGVPDRKMSVYNKYGITAEAKYKEISGKSKYEKDYSIFKGKISIPRSVLKSNNNTLSIMVLLRGVRLQPLPVGATLGTLMNTTPEEDIYFSNIQNWSHNWINYDLK
ncbi:hypothetical protein [Sphingobacterium paucimobilis]|uniref:DUF4833 domain-containing protein n=1 Tax=Sphingobacterium paucimobilis HER1398 TaxID=1346330 RepID=U2J5D7_9SPHI|nr:hypothetical protein [Sphingobacterium paucimobilis]ERJ60139.1 hypothetical protein M472_15345 [Sphingobacterium paucimobilis HER1398]